MKKALRQYSEADISRMIEMAWEDRTPFEAIFNAYGLNPSTIVQFMRQQMSSHSFKLWRKRVAGRKTKHLQQRPNDILRAYSSRQYKPR